MENKKVLIITENTRGYFINTVKNAIDSIGIEATLVAGTFGDVDAIPFFPPLVVVSIGDTDTPYHILIPHILQKCEDSNSKIILIATNQTDLDSFKEALVSKVIDDFLRPVDLSLFADVVRTRLLDIQNNGHRKHILVVDDSGVILRSLHSMLENDYSVALANSASVAFTSISKLRPDLILLDYEMPVCSGAQFLEMLRADEELKTIPVFFLTSKSDAESVKSVMALKPEGYILKTEDNSQLLQTIRSFFYK